MTLGACGYFEQDQPNHSMQFVSRPCDHPEAALIIVRKKARERCPYSGFTYNAKGKRKGYVCTQLNAEVGDCFTDPATNKGDKLELLRKLPCGSPGVHQVNTRIERADSGVCSPVQRKYADTTAVYFKQPPVSFCLHLVGS